MLNQFRALRLLSIQGTLYELDFEPLKKLKKTRWLSLPESTTQEQLVAIIRSNPKLVFLDLSNCENITDLAPVHDLTRLRYLIVNVLQAEPSSMLKMARLEWLAVFGDNDQERIKEIQGVLPNTEIVKLEPFCLGSGWILLLLPVIAGAWWMSGRRRRVGHHMGKCHG